MSVLTVLVIWPSRELVVYHYPTFVLLLFAYDCEIMLFGHRQTQMQTLKLCGKKERKEREEGRKVRRKEEIMWHWL